MELVPGANTAMHPRTASSIRQIAASVVGSGQWHACVGGSIVGLVASTR